MVYKKRVFYWDEDSYGAGITESYDATGALYRVGYPMSFPFYGDYGGASGTTIFTDFQTGSWLLYGATSDKGGGFWPVPLPATNAFSPEALAGEGIR